MNLMPTRKMATVGVAGSITAVLVWSLSMVGVELPPDVASAITTLIAFGGGWLVSEK